MKCASVLRETLWGAVSHECSTIDFDYAHYTRTWLERLDVVCAGFSAVAVGPGRWPRRRRGFGPPDQPVLRSPAAMPLIDMWMPRRTRSSVCPAR